MSKNKLFCKTGLIDIYDCVNGNCELVEAVGNTAYVFFFFFFFFFF